MTEERVLAEQLATLLRKWSGELAEPEVNDAAWAIATAAEAAQAFLLITQEVVADPHADLERFMGQVYVQLLRIHDQWQTLKALTGGEWVEDLE